MDDYERHREAGRLAALARRGLHGFICEICGKKKASQYAGARRCQKCLKSAFPALYDITPRRVKMHWGKFLHLTTAAPDYRRTFEARTLCGKKLRENGWHFSHPELDRFYYLCGSCGKRA